MFIFDWRTLLYIAVIAASVMLPELYLRLGWSLRKLQMVRLATLLVTAILATVVGLWAFPHTDPATMFTRVFIYIGVCRMILLSSHQYSGHKPPAQEHEHGTE